MHYDDSHHHHHQQQQQHKANNIHTPATPGVWAVSHRDLDRVKQERAAHSNNNTNDPNLTFELATDVTFIWPYHATSAFVTGTFSNWETTVAMAQTSSPDGPIWLYSKALPPGDYQYKFIIDNVWRHAPDQPITFDERGIINNFLTVTVEPCGDITCFCSRFFSNNDNTSFNNNNNNINNNSNNNMTQTNHIHNTDLQQQSPSQQIAAGVMTPKTVQRIRKNIGVAYKYVEHDTTPQHLSFRKAYMHTEVPDRPFDVTVVNVQNLPSTRNSFIDAETTDGTISRASSFENLSDATANFCDTSNESPSTSSFYLNNYDNSEQNNLKMNENDYHSMNKSSNNNSNNNSINVNNVNNENPYDEHKQKYQKLQQHNDLKYRKSNHSTFYNNERYRFRYCDPSVPIIDDAAYAAKLNDKAGTLPHTAPYRASALSSDPTQLAYSVRARLSSPILGFNPNECHEGIRLTDTNHCAVRVQERGLYKTVRSVLPLRDGNHKMYFEFFIFRQTTGGGVCIGLSTQELPLNCLCGTRPNSIGYSSSGNLIRTVDGKESWSDFGDELHSGCIVGCLVSMKTNCKTSKNKKGGEEESKDDGDDGGVNDKGGGHNNNEDNDNSGNTIEKKNNNDNKNDNSSNRRKRNTSKQLRLISTDFFADGKYKGTSCYEFVGDLEIFPTLSLFAKHARVYSLFNGEDMLFTSCLPQDETIMTLDGQTVQRGTNVSPKDMELGQTEVSQTECLVAQR